MKIKTSQSLKILNSLKSCHTSDHQPITRQPTRPARTQSCGQPWKTRPDIIWSTPDSYGDSPVYCAI